MIRMRWPGSPMMLAITESSRTFISVSAFMCSTQRERSSVRPSRSATWPSTDQPPKPVSCASVKSISTFGGRVRSVLIVHLRGDCMITGNIVTFTRSVRVSSKPVRALSGNFRVN